MRAVIKLALLAQRRARTIVFAKCCNVTPLLASDKSWRGIGGLLGRRGRGYCLDSLRIEGEGGLRGRRWVGDAVEGRHIEGAVVNYP
jgi:hypothetical protein